MLLESLLLLAIAHQSPYCDDPQSRRSLTCQVMQCMPLQGTIRVLPNGELIIDCNDLKKLLEKAQPQKPGDCTLCIPPEKPPKPHGVFL